MIKHQLHAVKLVAVNCRFAKIDWEPFS